MTRRIVVYHRIRQYDQTHTGYISLNRQTQRIHITELANILHRTSMKVYIIAMSHPLQYIAIET